MKQAEHHHKKPRESDHDASNDVHNQLSFRIVILIFNDVGEDKREEEVGRVYGECGGILVQVAHEQCAGDGSKGIK